MKILLVDDHQLFREGVALLLRRLADDLELLQTSTCEEAFSLCETQPDTELILLDLSLVGMNGFEGLSVLRQRFPHIPVVVMSSSEDPVTVRKAIDLGAMGFIPKSSSSEIMLNALRLVLANGIYLPPNVLLAEPSPTHAKLRSTVPQTGAPLPGPTAKPLTPHDLGLTPRQADALYLVLQGKPIKLICRELALGEGTVKGHVSAVLRALNVTTRTQAIVAAHRLGLQFERVSDRTSVTRTADRT
jgi:DNA-binding NarL/FixJ family response regulator